MGLERELFSFFSTIASAVLFMWFLFHRQSIFSTLEFIINKAYALVQIVSRFVIMKVN